MISLDAKLFPITWVYKNTLLRNVFEASRLFPLTWGRRMCCLALRNHTSHYKVEAGSLLFLFLLHTLWFQICVILLFCKRKTAFFLIERGNNTMHKAWHYYIFPWHTKRGRGPFTRQFIAQFPFLWNTYPCGFDIVTSQIRDMKIFITTTWTERRLFEIASSLWHDTSACMCVSVFATSSAALKFLKVWQCYHCNHHTHMVTIPPYGLKYGRRKKKEIWERDNGGKTNKVKLEGGK